MSEQSDAHEALHDAIRRVIALDGDTDGMLLTDWVVSYTCVRASDAGSQIYGACYPNGQAPAYRSLGLLRITEHQLITNGWEDEAGP